MYTLEKENTSMLCILYTLMPQIIPLLTLTLVHVWYEKPTPLGDHTPCNIGVCLRKLVE